MIDPWRTTFHHAEGGLSWRRQLIKMANRHISQWLEQLSLFTIHSMAVAQACDIIKLRQISTEGPESSPVCEYVYFPGMQYAEVLTQYPIIPQEVRNYQIRSDKKKWRSHVTLFIIVMCSP